MEGRAGQLLPLLNNIMAAEVGVVGRRFSTLTTLSKHLCHRGKAEDMKTELQACKTLRLEKTDG